MNKKLSLLFTFLLFTSICRGGSIQWNIANWYCDTGYWSGQYILDIGGLIYFATQQVNTSPDQATLVNFRWAWVARECTLLLVDSGTFINYDLFANSNDLFYQTIPDWPFPGEPDRFINWNIPLTDDDLMNTIIMAFALSKWTEDGPVIDYYGWIELGYDGEEVYIVNSAMIDGMWSGIYAGVIPEPSTVLLAVSGCAFMLLRRRKRPLSTTREATAKDCP